MKTTHLFRTLILAAGFAMAAVASAAPISAAFEFDTPTFSYDDGYSYNLGISFRADQNLNVNALAYYDDGPSFSSHSVALFTMDGIKLAETIVNPGDLLLGNFRYSSIAPVMLNAGSLYRIIGNSTGDKFTFDVRNFLVNPLLTYMGYSYSDANDTIAQFDANAYAGSDIENAVWGASLSVSAANVSVPEPASVVLMLSGLALLAGAARRQKQ
jgi:hypothetical protein